MGGVERGAFPECVSSTSLQREWGHACAWTFPARGGTIKRPQDVKERRGELSRISRVERERGEG